MRANRCRRRVRPSGRQVGDGGVSRPECPARQRCSKAGTGCCAARRAADPDRNARMPAGSRRGRSAPTGRRWPWPRPGAPQRLVLWARVAAGQPRDANSHAPRATGVIAVDGAAEPPRRGGHHVLGGAEFAHADHFVRAHRVAHSSSNGSPELQIASRLPHLRRVPYTFFEVTELRDWPVVFVGWAGLALRRS